jgi:enoyl-CoA hydratase/carnithine racemase
MTASTPPREKVLLDYDGPVAIISNNNPDKRNAFDDEMDLRLFEILAELSERRDIRAVIWRGNGHSFSTGRDVSAIGATTDVSHHELMRRGHRGMQKLFEIDAPIIAALQGWSIGGSFQRALLCDIRVAAEGARFMLPELTHGVIPDTGGVGVLYEMCGHGVVSDLVLTGRAMSASEALAHGVVSRVVPADQLDAAVREMADDIAAKPRVTVNMARRIIRNLSEPQIRSSMSDELIAQTFINKSSDYAELRAARAEDRAPHYTGS